MRKLSCFAVKLTVVSSPKMGLNSSTTDTDLNPSSPCPKTTPEGSNKKAVESMCRKLRTCNVEGEVELADDVAASLSVSNVSWEIPTEGPREQEQEKEDEFDTIRIIHTVGNYGSSKTSDIVEGAVEDDSQSAQDAMGCILNSITTLETSVEDKDGKNTFLETIVEAKSGYSSAGPVNIGCDNISILVSSERDTLSGLDIIASDDDTPSVDAIEHEMNSIHGGVMAAETGQLVISHATNHDDEPPSVVVKDYSFDICLPNTNEDSMEEKDKDIRNCIGELEDVAMEVEPDKSHTGTTAATVEKSVSIVPTPTPPTPPPLVPAKDNNIEDAAILKKELDRVQADLTWTRHSKTDLLMQLGKAQNEVITKTQQLTDAGIVMMEQQKALNNLVAMEMQIEKLQNDLERERGEKGNLLEKYQKLKNAVSSMGGEFSEIFQELQKHFRECCKSRKPNLNEKVPLENVKEFQGVLDNLSINVERKLQCLSDEQKANQTVMGNTVIIMEEMIDLLESTPSSSISKPSPPAPPTPPASSSEPIPSTSSVESVACSNENQEEHEKVEHGEDMNKTHQGFYCVRGRRYNSKNSLSLHIKKLTWNKELACGKCSQRFVFPSELRNHQKRAHKTKKNMTIKRKKMKRNGKRKTTGNNSTFVCGSCGQSFLYKRVLIRHRQRKSCRKKINSDHEIPTPLRPSTSKSSTNEKAPPSPVTAYTVTDSDDDVVILDEVGETPEKISINTTPTRLPSVIIPIMSRVALSLASFPAPPVMVKPLPVANSTDAIKHCATIQKKFHISFTGKRHSRDITQRNGGFYCICGIKFISRKRLDGHIMFHNEVLSKKKKNNDSKDRVGDETRDRIMKIKKEKTDDSSVQKRKLDNKKYKKMEHGCQPANPLKCICGHKPTSSDLLLTHIKYCTSERKFACKMCPKMFVHSSHLQQHYRTAHKSRARTQEPDPELDNNSDSPHVSPQAIPIPTKPAKLPQKHKAVYTKSRRENFCKCGLRFQSKRKLNIHINSRRKEEAEEQRVKENMQNTQKFACMTCGEMFDTNVERIYHRVQSHGHGLFSK